MAASTWRAHPQAVEIIAPPAAHRTFNAPCAATDKMLPGGLAVSTATAWLVAAAVWLGCLLPGHWLLVVLSAVLLAVPPLTRRRVLRMAVVAVAMVGVGSGLAGARLALGDRGPLVALARAGGASAMTAAVVTDARPSETGKWLLLRVSSVGGRATGERAMVRLGAEDEAPALGSRVAFTGSARPLTGGGFAAYLTRLHVVAIVHPTGGLTVTSPPPSLLAATTHVRIRVREVVARHLPSDHAALLSGLVTGDTTGLSPAGDDALLAAGLSHLVAVSGSNVALVVAGTVAVAAACQLGARGRRRAAVVALLWFAVLVRGEPSVLRATTMALLVIAAGASGRGHDARHTLAVAATLLLLVDPMLAGQLGFTLSVLATAGVLVVGPAIAAHVPGPRPLAVLTGATAGAQIGVAPVLLTTEGGVALGSLPANLVAVPAAAVASAVGVAAALVAQVVPGLASLVALMARPALDVVLWAGHTFADSSRLEPHHLTQPAVLLAATLLVLRRRMPHLVAAALVVTVLGATVGVPLAGPEGVEVLSLSALDVGQGDAILVEVPGVDGGPPARMLVDGGPDQSLALRALRRRGVRFLDAVVVSHPHADHTDGLPAVLAGVDVGAVLVGPRPPHDLEDPAVSAAAVEVLAAQRGVPVLRVAAGQHFTLGGGAVEVLSPPGDASLGREPNDNSLVLRVVSPDGAILLTGDAEEAAQQRLLARPDLLRADVLKVPHHGGNTNAEGFLRAVGAHTAVIGVGVGNDYGHPHPDVLADLQGAMIMRTDTDGSVTVTAARP